ncbi:dihydrodipicolinate synthase family protein [Methylobacterium sp. DB0501]|nr:dihydrodipicolinate synthase family protein [Methylobacterium sp. DB0501]
MHAATIVPMRGADFALDLPALERHLHAVATRPGIRGLLLNGHAGENFVLDRAEKVAVIEAARRVVPEGCLLVSGVNAESSLEAAREAAAFERAGADGLLVFPPNSWALGHDPECVMLHHRTVAAATSLPLMLYGAPVGAGAMAYDAATLRRLAGIEQVVAIKEGSWEVAQYEANLRLLTGLRADFKVLGSGDEHLLTSYLIGSVGSQVSLAAVVPDLVAALWAAAEAGDWAQARQLHETLYPLAVAIYRDAPGGRATARLKHALHHLGAIPDPCLRPPQPPLDAGERGRVEEALHLALA